MTRSPRKKTPKSLLDFVRRVRAASGLTESEFARALGLPKPTIKAICNPKSQRRASEEHLALILLACGAEFPDSTPSETGTVAAKRHFSPEEYVTWQQVHDIPLSQIRSLIDTSITNAETLLAAAAARKKLLVALYHFELHLRKLMQNLDLTEDITNAEENGEVGSSLSQPENITSDVLKARIESNGL